MVSVQERMVAVESLGWISQILKASHHSLQAMLPQDSLNSVEFFYACTVCTFWMCFQSCSFFSVRDLDLSLCFKYDLSSSCWQLLHHIVARQVGFITTNPACSTEMWQLLEVWHDLQCLMMHPCTGKCSPWFSRTCLQGSCKNAPQHWRVRWGS